MTARREKGSAQRRSERTAEQPNRVESERRRTAARAMRSKSKREIAFASRARAVGHRRRRARGSPIGRARGGERRVEGATGGGLSRAFSVRALRANTLVGLGYRRPMGTARCTLVLLFRKAPCPSFSFPLVSLFAFVSLTARKLPSQEPRTLPPSICRFQGERWDERAAIGQDERAPHKKRERRCRDVERCNGAGGRVRYGREKTKRNETKRARGCGAVVA